MNDRAIHQINQFVPPSPVAQGDGSRARMEFAITTGDSLDNQQRNEAEWVVQAARGRHARSQQRQQQPRRLRQCPPGTPGPAEAAHYTGVQDYNDYFEGPTRTSTTPTTRAGAFSGWPRYPGLMDRAEQPVPGRGPDGAVLRRARQPRRPGPGQRRRQPPRSRTSRRAASSRWAPHSSSRASGGDRRSDPASCEPAAATRRRSRSCRPTRTASSSAPRSTRRCTAALANQADGHGFGFVDPAEQAASNGAAAYYSWSPQPGLPVHRAQHGRRGRRRQRPLLRREHRRPAVPVARARAPGRRPRANELIVLFGHHAINSLNNQRAGRGGAAVHRHRRRPRSRHESRAATSTRGSRPRSTSASRASASPATRPRRCPSCCCVTRT